MDQVKRKRGRPKKKILKKEKYKKLFDIKSINEINKTDYTNLLVHLPIDISLINNEIDESYEQEYLNYKNILTNIENEPKPFEQDDNELIEEKINYEKKINILEDKVIVNNRTVNTKVYILNKEEDVLCWWCCHNYDNQTYGIPLKKEEGKYITKGYFCSLNCAKSYNNNESITLKDKQSRNLLIEILNDEITEEEEVICAPPRESLKVFGGYLTIEEFRKNKNSVKLIYPPLVTILPIIEELITEEKNDNVKINKNMLKNNLLKLFK